MFSIDDHISTYENKENEELLNMHKYKDRYSYEANEALDFVIKDRGGLDILMKESTNSILLINEANRIAKETIELASQGVDIDFIKTITTSKILSAEKVKEIVEQKSIEIELNQKDREINPRTVIGSIIGGTIASIVGGILWGIQVIYTHVIYNLFYIGLALICYGIIKVATKQTQNNKVVLIATIVSFFIALLIGRFFYLRIGYL